MFEVCDFSSSCNSHSQVVRYLLQWLHALRMFQAAEVVTRVHHSMHALGVLPLKQGHCVLLHYSVNAGEAPMTHDRLLANLLGLRGDSGYGGSSTASADSGYIGSSTASADLGYGSSSTAAISTHSTSHLVERYQKMLVHPLAEGKLRYT